MHWEKVRSDGDEDCTGKDPQILHSRNVLKDSGVYNYAVCLHGELLWIIMVGTTYTNIIFQNPLQPTVQNLLRPPNEGIWVEVKSRKKNE